MSEPVGTIAELWRYPVKSMQGERLEQAEVGPEGVVGDRGWALRSDRRHVLSAKTVADLLHAVASTDADGRVTATLPDGTSVPMDDPAAAATLSAWLGRSVTPVQPGESDELTYEMTFDPPDDAAERVEIPTPPDSLQDWGPLHLLTTASLAAMAARRPELTWDRRRFRPNVVVAVDAEAFVEDAWVGGELRVGDCRIAVAQATVRCALPLRAQPGGLDRQPAIFAALDEAHANHLGVYARVVTPGTLAVGDAVILTT